MSGPAGVPPVLPAAPTPPGSPGGMSRSRIVAIGRTLPLAEGDADTGFPDGSGPIWVGRFAPVGSKVDPAIGREVDLDPGVGVVVEDALGAGRVTRPGQEPLDHPGRDVQVAQDGRHRQGVPLAEALLERREALGRRPVAAVDVGDIRAVVVRARPELLLERLGDVDRVVPGDRRDLVLERLGVRPDRAVRDLGVQVDDLRRIGPTGRPERRVVELARPVALDLHGRRELVRPVPSVALEHREVAVRADVGHPDALVGRGRGRRRDHRGVVEPLGRHRERDLLVAGLDRIVGEVR